MEDLVLTNTPQRITPKRAATHSPSCAPKAKRSTNIKRSKRFKIPDGWVVDPTGNFMQPPPKGPGSSRSKRSSRDGSTMSVGSVSSGRDQATTTEATVGEPKRAKPIVVQLPFKALEHFCDNLMVEKPLLKLTKHNETHIICASEADKNKVTTKLREQKVQHYTYAETKPFVFVLKGLYHQPTNDVLIALKAEEIPAFKVAPLTNNPELPAVFLVFFERETKMNIHRLSKHKSIQHIMVRWELQDGNRRRIPQCGNCRRLGHTTSGCGMAFRCIKCLNDHPPSSCPRKTRNDEGSPQCVNCKGMHAANSRSCPVYTSYASTIQRQRAPQRPATHASHSSYANPPRASLAWASPRPEDFPQLPNLNREETIPRPKILMPLYANQVRPTPKPKVPLMEQRMTRLENMPQSQPAGSYESLMTAQNELRAIPGINDTIRTFCALVAELKAAKSEPERIMILLQHCTPTNVN